MARVPLSIVPDTGPAPTPPPDYQRIESSPANFGGLIGQAEQKFGQEGQQAAGNLAQSAEILQQRYNDHAVTDSVNKLQTAAENLTYGDQSDPTAAPGLYTLKGAAAMRAGPQVSQQINDLRDQISSGLQNDAQRLEFQKQTVRYLQYKRAEIANHIIQQTNVYGLAQEDAAIGVAAMSAGNNPDTLNPGLRDASLHASKVALLKYGPPPDPTTSTQEQIDGYNNIVLHEKAAANTRIIQSAIDGMMARDPTSGPAQAAQILTQYGSLMLPNVREELARQTTAKAIGVGMTGNIQDYLSRQPPSGAPPTGGTPAPLPDAVRQRAQVVHDAAVQQGASDDEAWGIAANAVHESSAQAAPPVGDGGISHGMFQLNKDQLANYQATHGGHLPEQDDVATQVAFARKQAAPYLGGVSGADGYSAAYTRSFEVPAGGEGEVANRAATAVALKGAPPQISRQFQPQGWPVTIRLASIDWRSFTLAPQPKRSVSTRTTQFFNSSSSARPGRTSTN